MSKNKIGVVNGKWQVLPNPADCAGFLLSKSGSRQRASIHFSNWAVTVMLYIKMLPKGARRINK